MGCQVSGQDTWSEGGSSQGPSFKFEMLRASKLISGWRQAHHPEITLKNPQQLIAYFPLFPPPQLYPLPPLPSTLCAWAWHVGPFVVLIETETCLGPGVCCFNSTVEGFFFFSFVCFSFPFSLPKPGGQ